MHFSSYELPLIMPRFACATIQEAFGTYRRWHWTSTLLTVINEIMIYSTSSSAIHTGIVCATRFPAMWTRTFGPHHSAINMQRVGLWQGYVPSTSTAVAGSGDGGGRSGDGHAGSRWGDAGSLDRGSSVSGGALGLKGCTTPAWQGRLIHRDTCH